MVQVGQGDKCARAHRLAGLGPDFGHRARHGGHQFGLLHLAQRALEVQFGLGHVQLGRLQVLGRSAAQQVVQLGLGLDDLGLGRVNLVGVRLLQQGIQLGLGLGHLGPRVRYLVGCGPFQRFVVLGQGLLIVGGGLPQVQRLLGRAHVLPVRYPVVGRLGIAQVHLGQRQVRLGDLYQVLVGPGL